MPNRAQEGKAIIVSRLHEIGPELDSLFRCECPPGNYGETYCYLHIWQKNKSPHVIIFRRSDIEDAPACPDIRGRILEQLEVSVRDIFCSGKSDS